MYKLDINKMRENRQMLKIGRLTQDIINILDLDIVPCNIKFGYDRIEHCRQHINDFKSIKSFNNSMTHIPEIINNPDYIGFNVNNNSIEYIKKIDDLTLVAVRLKQKDDLFLRSVYPITESKLQNGIRLGRIKEIKRVS